MLQLGSTASAMRRRTYGMRNPCCAANTVNPSFIPSRVQALRERACGARNSLAAPCVERPTFVLPGFMHALHFRGRGLRHAGRCALEAYTRAWRGPSFDSAVADLLRTFQWNSCAPRSNQARCCGWPSMRTGGLGRLLRPAPAVPYLAPLHPPPATAAASYSTDRCRPFHSSNPSVASRGLPCLPGAAGAAAAGSWGPA